MGKSLINGPLSSKSCLITGGYMNCLIMSYPLDTWKVLPVWDITISVYFRRSNPGKYKRDVISSLVISPLLLYHA